MNCFLITQPECTGDAVIALCDEQVTAEIVLHGHAYQQWSAIDQK